MPTRRSRAKSGGRRYGEAASKSVESAMRRRKKGTLKSGKAGRGGRVKSRAQAIAIGLSQAREKGAKVPSPSGRGGRRSSSRRSSGASRSRTTGTRRSSGGGSRRGTSSRSSRRST